MKFLIPHIIILLLMVGPKASAQSVLLKDTVLATYLCKKAPTLMSSDCKYLDTLAAGKVTGGFSFSNGNIRNISEIAYFKNLAGLNIIGNPFEDLPDLSKMKRLRVIDLRGGVGWNKPEQLFPIKSTLQVLYIGLNEEKSLEDLNFLEQFTYLTKFQCLNCKTQSLPDFRKFPNLTNVQIPNNRLSFEDLLPLTKIPNYDSIFVAIFPQLNLTKDTTFKIGSNQPLKLATTIDKGIAGITYEWYKNNQLVQSSSSPELTIPSVQVSDTGTYVQKIKSDHPFFSGQSLRTGDYQVQVCESVSSVELADLKGCDEIPFQIQSINKNPKYPAASLKLTSTKDTQAVEIGKQYLLASGTYGLIVKDTLGCTFTYNPVATLTKSNCQDIFSPNNDGHADEIYLEGTGKAMIRNKNGIVVNELELPSSWKGTDTNGNPLTIGLYVVEFSNGSQKKVTLVR